MSKKNEEKPPLGGWLVLVGAIVGVGFGNKVAGGLGAIIGFFVGGYLGLAIEHIIFRLILVALFILMMLARQAFFGGILDSFSRASNWPAVESCCVAELVATRAIKMPVSTTAASAFDASADLPGARGDMTTADKIPAPASGPGFRSSASLFSERG